MRIPVFRILKTLGIIRSVDLSYFSGVEWGGISHCFSTAEVGLLFIGWPDFLVCLGSPACGESGVGVATAQVPHGQPKLD